MLRAFEQAVRPYIPVVSHTKQKHEPLPVVPRPAVGVRWGKPSRFEHSNADPNNNPEGGFILLDQAAAKKITATEVYRQWEKVTAPAVDDPGTTFEFERPKELIFFVDKAVVTEETERMNNDVKIIETDITTIYHYIRISFPLNKPEEQIGETGERGEHPDDTLAQVQAAYNDTIAGGMQKAKEGWEGVFESTAAKFKVG